MLGEWVSLMNVKLQAANDRDSMPLGRGEPLAALGATVPCSFAQGRPRVNRPADLAPRSFWVRDRQPAWKRHARPQCQGHPPLDDVTGLAFEFLGDLR